MFLSRGPRGAGPYRIMPPPATITRTAALAAVVISDETDKRTFVELLAQVRATLHFKIESFNVAEEAQAAACSRNARSGFDGVLSSHLK